VPEVMWRTGQSESRRSPRAILVAAALACLCAGCAKVSGSEATDTVTIGAYSVVREALREGLLPAFAEHWKRTTGRTVRFEESYNASGAQARAIAAGFDADVAILSLEDDVDLLVKAGVVAKDWRKLSPDGGMITRSLVVVGVRPGNPKGVRDWVDLRQPGVGVLYPDPKTSGGAKWNINAIYGAGLLGPKPGTPPNPDAARDILAAVQKNVVNMDSSGRQSLATFERGTGDAVVTYENELKLREKRGGGDPIETIVPARTLLIEGPAVLVDSSIARHGNRKVAEAFLDFARSPEGQQILSDYGFRRVDAPVPPGVFSMKDLGGWGEIKTKVYGPKGVWNNLFTDRSKSR
jgi:sulfate/thiosulfate-binding protein